MEFIAFPKIPRLRREVVITEKIDGTNAQVVIVDCQDPRILQGKQPPLASYNGMTMYAGSRNRFITPEDDNFGFAKWCVDNQEELMSGLGIGQHFGEWYGRGIQRGYDMDTRRFALFNTDRWQDGRKERPECCGVVPVLWQGEMDVGVSQSMLTLQTTGSVIKNGFANPEGIVVFHRASRSLFKVLLENDDKPKGLSH